MKLSQFVPIAAALFRISAAWEEDFLNKSLLPRESLQDFDPNGIICSTDSDCTDPGYPYCVCGFVQTGSCTEGGCGSPTFTYLCSSNCAADGCLPDCESCNCGNCPGGTCPS